MVWAYIMYFDSFNDFIAMGGHGLYVWLSYGIFALIMLWIVCSLKLDRRSALNSARKTWARENPDTKPDTKPIIKQEVSQ